MDEKLNLKNAGGQDDQLPIFEKDYMKGTRTYSDQELKDPNSIVTTIGDRRTPLVILFGSTAIGKSVALIRLTRFLEGQGYTVQPDPLFRPAYDTNYQAICNNFRDVVYSPIAVGGTGVVNFMLIKVSDRRRSICQIVEAPGEHYFDPENVFKPFPLYLNNIFLSPNRKVWIFIVKKNWEMDEVVKRHLAERIQGMKTGNGQPFVRPGDRVVFMCTQVDKRESQVVFTNTGFPNIPMLHTDIGNEYRINDGSNLYTTYENTHAISRLWRPHNYSFIPFSAGTFNQANNGKLYFNIGPDYYPSMLWKCIK